MKKLIIGVDPGLSGGIAVLDENGKVVEVRKMPETMADIYNFLTNYSNLPSCCDKIYESVCYMENVGHGMPGQSSKSTAVFSRHNGHLEMALLALRIPTNMITPQKWEKFYQLGKSSGCEKREWKNKLKAKCQQLFPNENITLAVCDALLIAEYGRKQEIHLAKRESEKE